MEFFQFNIFRILLILFYTSTTLAMSSSNCTLADLITYKTTVSDPKMRFYLFTRTNPNIEQEIIINDDDEPSLLDSNYRNEWKTRIMVHGWKGNLTSCVNAYVKDAYLQKDNFNVIIIDWYDWSQDSDYFKLSSIAFVNTLGQLIADFIIFLNKSGTLYNNIYLIGHSMGAHLAGSAGRKLPEPVNTIFGLDPAGLYFTGEDEKILKCTDAKYVEAIITSMGVWGYTGKIGCSTYYPNYGLFQPYCLKYEITNPVCDHVTSVRYFSESITSVEGFCAADCDYTYVLGRICNLTIPGLINPNPMSCALKMGGEPSIPKYGGRTFYLATKDTSPFAIGCCQT